jgi:hypothetical protein
VIENHYLPQKASHKGGISLFFHNWEFPFVGNTEVFEVGYGTAINE